MSGKVKQEVKIVFLVKMAEHLPIVFSFLNEVIISFSGTAFTITIRIFFLNEGCA